MHCVKLISDAEKLLISIKKFRDKAFNIHVLGKLVCSDVYSFSHESVPTEATQKRQHCHGNTIKETKCIVIKHRNVAKTKTIAKEKKAIKRNLDSTSK